jgi:23S rRNA G2069 N7-methylase RlmK/C1962 C5-methylase RlmI
VNYDYFRRLNVLDLFLSEWPLYTGLTVDTYIHLSEWPLYTGLTVDTYIHLSEWPLYINFFFLCAS